MNPIEEQRLKRAVANLELRIARLEAMLMKAGVQIGETEHGDAVMSVGSRSDGGGRMAAAILVK
jgi:hypothetical protein